jgi:hypothetical protein
MNNKYKQFVKYNILNKKTSPFGWYENVYVFKIHSVSTKYDISENGETRDIIEIICEYNDDYADSFRKTYKTYYKTLEYYKSDYDDYITDLRNNKLNELGIE